MGSLRGRLGVLVGAGAIVITVVASMAIAFERWQEENRGFTQRVEFAAFDLSATPAPWSPDGLGVEAADGFVMVLDDAAEVLAQNGDVSAPLLERLIEDVWSETTEQDAAFTVEYEIDGKDLFVFGVACVPGTGCDTVIVGGSESALGPFLWARWMWLTAPGLLAGLGAALASRWLVGRSLSPVDGMRRELESITATDLDRRVPVPTTGDELQRLGETLNQMIKRLGAAATANERFVADAAHELRSPITGAKAALEVEAAKSPGGLIEASVGELDRASRLIDDLLLLARRQGRPEQRVEVDLDDLVRQELTAAAGRFPEVSIERRLQPVRVIGEADALRRVVVNLLENACRHSGARVVVTLDRREGQSHLVIDDDGPGVPIDDRERIFERFARVDASRSRSTGGSGLGLAIVREIVLAHGGSVAVDDSPLGGARFVFSIPLSESGYDYHIEGSE